MTTQDWPSTRDEIIVAALTPGPMRLNDLAKQVARRARTDEDHVVADFWSLVQEGAADYNASAYASLAVES